MIGPVNGKRAARLTEAVRTARRPPATSPPSTRRSSVDDEHLRVAVIGANGRIGSEAVRAVEAAPDLELVAALGRDDQLDTLVDAGAQVAVELTHPDAVMGNLEFCPRPASTPWSALPAGPRSGSACCDGWLAASPSPAC